MINEQMAENFLLAIWFYLSRLLLIQAQTTYLAASALQNFSTVINTEQFISI